MDIRKFQSIIQSEGVSRPGHYYVEIQPPKTMLGALQKKGSAGQIGLLCDTISIPGRLINTTNHMIYGVERKMPYGVQYQDITASFICTDTFAARKFFDEWHASINNPVDNSFNYYDEYTTDIIILKVNSQNQPVEMYILKEAYPGAVSSQSLSAAPGSEYMTVEVTFNYRKWLTLTDMARAEMPLPNLEIEGIDVRTGDAVNIIGSAVLDQLAGNTIASGTPKSLTYEQAAGIIQKYQSFIQSVININTNTIINAIGNVFRNL